MSFRDYLDMGGFPSGPPYDPPCKVNGARCGCEAYAKFAPGSVITCGMDDAQRESIRTAQRIEMMHMENLRESSPVLDAFSKLPYEERVRNETTGGEKGQKLARFDLVPPRPLWELAEHYGKGARKYAERNWERGYAWSLSYQAAMRHLNQFWQGQDYEYAETERVTYDHLAAAAFHIFALMEFRYTHPELDNRPGREPDDQLNSNDTDSATASTGMDG